MAIIKSIKFYNFFDSRGVGGCLSVKFYDITGNLIAMDFSNRLSTSSTYSETNEYIVTSNASENSDRCCNYQAFHTGNFDKTVNLPTLGYTWVPHGGGKVYDTDWIKIEFKTPISLSNIRINHTYSSSNFFNNCNYDIEYDYGKVYTGLYISDGTFAPYSVSTVLSGGYDQDVYDSYFNSIEFDKNIKIYNSEIGYVETLDTNNFRNIPVNTVEKLKVLYTKSSGTLMSCVVSFDQKQTWKSFNGTNWVDITDNSAQNIILNCMDIEKLNQLDKNKLIAGGFTGDLDFKIAMKSNDTEKTPSITKIYIEYK